MPDDATPAKHGPGAKASLRESARCAIRDYLERLDGQPCADVYRMVLAEVEAPLLEEILAYTGNNQTRAARMLGMSRGTLRKKLERHGLLRDGDERG